MNLNAQKHSKTVLILPDEKRDIEKKNLTQKAATIFVNIVKVFECIYNRTETFLKQTTVEMPSSYYIAL